MHLWYETHDGDDTLSLFTGEVFFLSDDGTGARLSCPMDDHLFTSSTSDDFDC